MAKIPNLSLIVAGIAKGDTFKYESQLTAGDNYDKTSSSNLPIYHGKLAYVDRIRMLICFRNS